MRKASIILQILLGIEVFIQEEDLNQSLATKELCDIRSPW